MRGGELQRPQVTKLMRNFHGDVPFALNGWDGARILYWLINRNSCWRTVSLPDTKLLLSGIGRKLFKLTRLCLTKS
jgi:hypothetical protein